MDCFLYARYFHHKRVYVIRDVFRALLNIYDEVFFAKVNDF